MATEEASGERSSGKETPKQKRRGQIVVIGTVLLVVIGLLTYLRSRSGSASAASASGGTDGQFQPSTAGGQGSDAELDALSRIQQTLAGLPGQFAAVLPRPPQVKKPAKKKKPPAHHPAHMKHPKKPLHPIHTTIRAPLHASHPPTFARPL